MVFSRQYVRLQRSRTWENLVASVTLPGDSEVLHNWEHSVCVTAVLGDSSTALAQHCNHTKPCLVWSNSRPRV